MINLLRSLLFITLLITAYSISNAQVYDPTMSPTQSGYSTGGAGSICTGTRNYVPDGNFNYFRVNSPSWSCVAGSYAQYNNLWSGTNLIQAPCGWLFNINNWPYKMRVYCSSPTVLPFQVGVAQMDFYKRSSLNPDYRDYMRADLTKPLNVGVQYLFEMDVISAFAAPDSNKLQLDKIGACFLQNLPVVSAGLPLTSLSPQFTTAVDTPVINQTIHLSGTITGNGEKYLLIGVFDSLNNITFNSTAGVNAAATYYIDNVHVYRPACNNAFVLFGLDSAYACPGDSFTVFGYGGLSPYQWRINGSLLTDTVSSIKVPVGYNDQIITIGSDTGICFDTDTFRLNSRWPLSTMPADTFKFCDSLVVMAPSFDFHNMNMSVISNYAWNGLTTVYNQSASTPFAATFPDTGLYRLTVRYNTSCYYYDTVHVSPRVPLLDIDSSGSHYLLPEINSEHCINMYDGEIIIHNVNYPSPLHYRWYQPVSTNVDTNAIYNLSFGLYHSVIWDEEKRCTDFSYYVSQTLDSCTMIKGTVYLDKNYNCINDSGDAALAYVRVNALPLPNAGFTDTAGNYQIIVPPGNYTIQRIYTDTTIAGFCSDTSVTTLFAGDIADSTDFADTLHLFTHNLSLDYFYSTRLRLAGLGYAEIGVTNRGDALENSIVKIYIHHPNIWVDTNFLPGFIGMSGDTMLFSTVLLPQQRKTIHIPMLVLIDFSYIGTIVNFYAHCETLGTTEFSYADNDIYHSEMFYAAYDPNDKSVTPAAAVIDTTQREFAYTIRFQNTGNDYATHIYVKDTISNNLDLGTLQLLSTSHQAQVYILDRTITFDFPSIMLPDSGADEPASHGYVQYRIKASSATTLGDVISNTAYIYFDSNPAVVTNTVRNEYGIPTTVPSDIIQPRDFIGIEIAPNPATESMVLLITNEQNRSVSYSITDLQGRNVMTGKINNSKTLIDIAKLSKGSYLFIASDGQQVVSKNLIKL